MINLYLTLSIICDWPFINLLFVILIHSILLGLVLVRAQGEMMAVQKSLIEIHQIEPQSESQVFLERAEELFQTSEQTRRGTLKKARQEKAEQLKIVMTERMLQLKEEIEKKVPNLGRTELRFPSDQRLEMRIGRLKYHDQLVRRALLQHEELPEFMDEVKSFIDHNSKNVRQNRFNNMVLIISLLIDNN